MELWAQISTKGAPRETVRRLLQGTWKTFAPQSPAPVLTSEHNGVYYACMENAVAFGAFTAALGNYSMTYEVLDGPPKGVSLRRAPAVNPLLDALLRDILAPAPRVFWL